MARLEQEFDHTSVEHRESLDPIPPGTYPAEVIESDIVPTKDGTGQRLTLTFRVTGGEFEGRRVWDSLNIRNQNEVAQKIAQQELAELCAACGIRGPLDDTEQLHGVPIQIRVKMSKPQDGYEQKNEVSRYYPADQTPRTASSARQTQNGGAPASVRQAAKPAGNRPWTRPAA